MHGRHGPRRRQALGLRARRRSQKVSIDRVPRLVGTAGLVAESGAGWRRSRAAYLSTRSMLAHVEPEDLVKFGLIPEFIGRLPIIATLEELDEKALVDILTRPKNALTKQ